MILFGAFMILVIMPSNNAHLISESVLDTYIKYCGSKGTCNVDTETVESSQVGLQERCYACLCNIQLCGAFYVCCPDSKIGSQRISTEDFEEWNFDHFSHYAIGTCPTQANSTIKNLCSQNWKHITDSEFYFVTSHNFDYKNKYCAMCNGVLRYGTGTLYMTCKSPGFPLNMYSSVDTLLTGAELFGCRVQFKGTIRLIENCNFTGLWNEVDPEMELACKYYAFAPYSIFKNIFCYICNTGLSPRPPYIDNCISHENVQLENMCLTEPVDGRFYPYKNQYCRACTMLSTPQWRFSASYVGNDDFGEYEWNVNIQPDFCYLWNLNVYKYIKISSVFDTLCPGEVLDGENNFALHREFENLFQNSIASRRKRSVNMTFLYEVYHNYTGGTPWCFPSDENTLCGCDTNCLSDGTCCPDVKFLSDSRCIEFGTFNTSVFTRCQHPHPDRVLQYYCERDEDVYQTIIDFIPVYSYQRRIHYKNLFCKYCSEIDDNYVEESYHSFWRISVKCEKYIDVELYIQFAKSYEELLSICEIILEPSDFHVIQPCSVKSNDETSVSDIQYMCEWGGTFIYSYSKSLYKNIFCEMHYIQKKCMNSSCEFEWSNSSLDRVIEVQFIKPSTKREHPYFYYPLEFTFNSIGQKENITKITATTSTSSKTVCNSEELHDKIFDKCRTIVCPFGKFLHEDVCIPLLDQVTVVGYHTMLTASATFSPGGNYSVKAILDEFAFYFRTDYLDQLLYATEVNLIVLLPCDNTVDTTSNNIKHLDILVDVKFESTNLVSRQEADEYIVARVANFQTVKAYGITFNVSKSDHNVTDLWSNRHSELMCFSSLACCSRQQPYYFEINEFLICPQIALDVEEYEQLNSKELKVMNLGQTHIISDFQDVDGDVLVCLSDYLKIIQNDFSAAGKQFTSFSVMTVSLLYIHVIYI